MLTGERHKTRLDSLVARLEQDIRQRGLWAGDPYLSAPEVAAMLGISATTAHRAMQALAARQMLIRRRNRGTFVGPFFEMKHSSSIRTVYALMPAPGLNTDTIPLDPFIYGVRSKIRNANVQVCFLPPGDARGYLEDLLCQALTAGNAASFVPISCPREIYRRLADSGAPTVVFGTPYIDQRDIPSVDVDNRMAGRLLMEHLIGGGHRRMAVLMAAEGQPGTNCFFDGVSEAMTQSELPHNALIQRSVPLENSAVEAQLRELLAMSEPPTAIIARTPMMAKAVMSALEHIPTPAADSCEIVYQDHPATEGGELPLTRVKPRVSFGEIIGRVGAMLNRLGEGKPLENVHEVIPMDLIATQRI
jgi:DNA-binding LacI/PurR family transcriptional regulator